MMLSELVQLAWMKSLNGNTVEANTDWMPRNKIVVLRYGSENIAFPEQEVTIRNGRVELTHFGTQVTAFNLSVPFETAHMHIDELKDILREITQVKALTEKGVDELAERARNLLEACQ